MSASSAAPDASRPLSTRTTRNAGVLQAYAATLGFAHGRFSLRIVMMLMLCCCVFVLCYDGTESAARTTSKVTSSTTDPSCSKHEGCIGLEGDCCPLDQGIFLDCCAYVKPHEASTTAPPTPIPTTPQVSTSLLRIGLTIIVVSLLCLCVCKWKGDLVWTLEALYAFQQPPLRTPLGRYGVAAGPHHETYKISPAIKIVCSDDGIVQEGGRGTNAAAAIVELRRPGSRAVSMMLNRVKPGWMIVNVDGNPFSQERLNNAKDSGSDYDVTLLLDPELFDPYSQNFQQPLSFFPTPTSTCDGTWQTNFGEVHIAGETGTYLGEPGSISSITWLSSTQIGGNFYNTHLEKSGRFLWTFDDLECDRFTGTWSWDDSSLALPTFWNGNRLSHHEAFGPLECGDRVKALPGRSLKEHYTEGDEGTVTKLEDFNGKKSHFQVTWDQSGNTSSMKTADWAFWVKKIGQDARVELEDARNTLGSSKLEATLRKHKGCINDLECKVYEEEHKKRKDAELELQSACLEPGCSVLEEALRKHEYVHVDTKSFLAEFARRKVKIYEKKAMRLARLNTFYLFFYSTSIILSALFICISAALAVVYGEVTDLAEHNCVILLYAIYYLRDQSSSIGFRIRMHCPSVVVAGGLALAHLGPPSRAIALIVAVSVFWLLGLWSLQLLKNDGQTLKGWPAVAYLVRLMISFVMICASIPNRNVGMLATLAIVLALGFTSDLMWETLECRLCFCALYSALAIIFAEVYYPLFLRYVIVTVILGAASVILSCYFHMCHLVRNGLINEHFQTTVTFRLTCQTVLLAMVISAVVSVSAFAEDQRRIVCIFGTMYLVFFSTFLSGVYPHHQRDAFFTMIDLGLLLGTVTVLPCITSPSVTMSFYAAIVGTDILVLYGPSVLASFASSGNGTKPLDGRSLFSRMIYRNIFMVGTWSACVVFFVVHALASGNGNFITGGTLGAQQASLRIRWLLLLPHKVPLYLNFVFATAKPIVMTAIFGYEPADSKSFCKKYLVSPFVALITLVALLADIRNVANVLLDDTLSPWQQYCGINIALAISSNLQTAFAFVTITLQYLASENFVASMAFNRMRRLQGSLWFWSMCCAALVYLSLVLVMAMSLFIVFVFFFWVFVPLGALVFGYSYFLEKQLRKSDELGCIGKCLKASGVGDKFRSHIDDEVQKLFQNADRSFEDAVAKADFYPHLQASLKPCSRVDAAEAWQLLQRERTRRRQDEGFMRQQREAVWRTLPFSRSYDPKFTMDLPGDMLIADVDGDDVPGRIRIFFGENGIVREVSAENGIRRGDKILKVCSNPFSKERLISAHENGSAYDVTIVRVRWISQLTAKNNDEKITATSIGQIKTFLLMLVPLTPMLGAMIPFVVPICIRWFMGVGYFTAFTHTFQDRNMTAFSKSMISRANRTVVNVMHVADEYHAGPVSTVCYVVAQWLQTFHYML